MDKLRVIIAETDLSYILPLQQCFLEKFLDRIEFEVVDNRTYFHKMFVVPQTAEVLIVCEELYNSSLRKHNLSHIFVLTEQQQEEYPLERNVVYVFKYTNIVEIFHKLSAPINLMDARRDPEIIVVSSAAGGVGKTTVALGLCGGLAKNYKKVLYINASRLQSFQHFFENCGAIVSPEIYESLNREGHHFFRDIQHTIRKEIFSYLPPFKMSLLSLGIPYAVYSELAVQAKDSGDYDYIVVDTESSFDAENSRLLGLADKVLMITDQSRSSVYATEVLLENISGVSNGKYFFVCNRFVKEEQNALVSSKMQTSFTVSEYVERFPNYDTMNCDDFAREPAFARVALLML